MTPSLADFTLSYVFSRKLVTLCFSFELERHDTAFTCLPSYRYSSFTLRAYLCWRRTYCQSIIELTKNVSPKNKMVTSHVVRKYLREVNRVTKPRSYELGEELLLWDFRKGETLAQWDCISDRDVKGNSFASFQPNGKGLARFTRIHVFRRVKNGRLIM